MDPDYDNYNMQYDEHDDPYHDSQEEEQTQTQSTQQASQPQTVQMDAHLWGYLQPCSHALNRIDFWKIHPRYTIGRNGELNQVILPGFKVSEYTFLSCCLLSFQRVYSGNQHCTITWDGRENGSSVVVLDLSSNGTFVSALSSLRASLTQSLDQR